MMSKYGVILGRGMGFYIRKSISAGPFRFNLSGSGIGMSVGVKGFRVGTGPRGNYVHMGRGGLYYRASLGAGTRSAVPHRRSYAAPTPQPTTNESLVPIEIGNVLEMEPANGSDVINQINEKMALTTLWPLALCLGGVLTIALLSQPNLAPVAAFAAFATLVTTLFCARWDQTRKAVVIMYDLGDEAAARFKSFSEEFEKTANSSRIWNIDTAGRTYDWKRNAGASRLISRKAASFRYDAPKVVQTNVSTPAIIGGRQNIFFLPDIVLIVEGARAGALSYDQFQVLWNTTVFIEEEGVPSDSQIVGYTWRFVNKNGGPDRRFNNNRQIPKVLYQQMGLQGDGGLQKILHFSKVADRSAFDTALGALRGFVKEIKLLALSPPQTGVDTPTQSQTENDSTAPPKKIDWLDIVWGTTGRQALTLAVLLMIGFGVSAYFSGPFVTVRAAPAPPPLVADSPAVVAATPVKPSFDCSKVSSDVLKLVCSTPELADADRELARTYALAAASVVSDRLLRQGERAWIRKRNRSPANVAVLRALYSKRTAFLKSLVR